MNIPKTIYLATREEWRAWLAANHATETEIWLIFYKAHTGMPRVPYEDAVEEALCFGWIDSLVHTMDDQRYAQKFSPRKPTSKWSESNKRRLRQLIPAGKMTEAGMQTLPEALLKELALPPEDVPPPPPKPVYETPADLETALKAQPKAWSNWERFTERYRQLALRWIYEAKRPETRAKRITEVAALTERNDKIGMK